MRDQLGACRGVKKVDVEFVGYEPEHRGEPVKFRFPAEKGKPPVEQEVMLGRTAKVTVTLEKFADAQALAKAIQRLEFTVIE